MKPISYLQTDPKWANIDYSARGEKTTIAKSGCGPSCMAMVIATLKNKAVTPKEACAWALAHGYKAVNQGTYYSYFATQGKAYGIAVSQLNGSNLYGKSSQWVKAYHAKALAEIKKGNMVICCMGKGNWTRSGHFILWYGLDKSVKALINDPNSTKAARTCAELSLLQSQVKYYFVVDVVNCQSHSDNYYKVQSKYGFDDTTMSYLEAYKYADSLFALMLQEDKNLHKYQLNTILYILEYKYGRQVFERINKGGM